MEEMYQGAKIKRYITIGIAALIIFMVLWIGLGFGESKKDKKSEIEVADIEVLEKEKTLDESIRARFSEELTSLKEENVKLQKELENLAKENTNMLQKSEKAQQKLIDDNKNASDKQYKDLLEQMKKNNENTKNESDKQFKDLLAQMKLAKPEEKKLDNLTQQANKIPPPPPNLAGTTGNREGDRVYQGNNSYPGGPARMETAPVVTVMTGLINVGDSKLQAEEVQKEQNNKKKQEDLIIPAGSFVKAQLASGVIAPTGGQGATDPVPALLRVTGLTQLPNFFKADIKNCFLLAETKGNLATETVNFRLKTLSCKKNDGTTLECEVSGYVTGENGMEGMAGRVVSKQGAIIARAFLAEFASGIGDVFEAQGTTTSITGAGVIESIDPNMALQSGVASGVSEAFSRLGDFYMDLAEQMVPVIEINAGRNVDVVFIKSVDLSKSENEMTKEQRKMQSVDKYEKELEKRQ